MDASEYSLHTSPDVIAVTAEATRLLYGGDSYAAKDLLKNWIVENESGANPSDLAAVNVSLGDVYLRETWLQLAGIHYDKALELTYRTEDLYWSLKAGLAKAKLHYAQKDFALSRRHLNDIAARSMKDGFAEIAASALGILGDMECVDGDLAVSLDLNTRALTIFRELNHPEGIAEQLSNLGRVHLNYGQHDESDRLFSESLKRYEEIGDLDQVAVQINNLAAVKVERCQFRESIPWFQRALELRHKTGNQAGIANQEEMIAHVYHRCLALPDRAVEWYKKSVSSLEKIRHRVAGSFDQQEIYFSEFFEVYQKLIELRILQYRANPDTEVLNELFNYVERAKAYVLLSRLQSWKRKEANTDKLDTRRSLQELRATRDALRQSLDRQHEESIDGSESDSTATSETRRQLDELDLTVQLIEANREELIPASIPTLAELTSDILLPDETLLSYYVAWDRVFCLELSRETAEPHDLGDKDELLDLADLYAKQASRKRLDLDISRRLGEFLTKEGSLISDPKRIYLVSPDDSINHVAFDFLAAGKEGKTTNLGLRFRMLSCPSASSLATMRQMSAESPTTESGDRFRAFVVPLSREQADISEASHECERLKTVLDVDEESVFFDSKATRARFEETVKDPLCCLHISTHGFAAQPGMGLSTVSVEEPSLALAGTPSDPASGRLWISEINSIPIRAQLVTLSACLTAEGRSVRGEGVESLARAFCAAGAECVVASHGKVRADVSQEFMINLYKNLRSLQIVDAFFRARSETADKFRDPQDWAAFILVGNARQRLNLGG